MRKNATRVQAGLGAVCGVLIVLIAAAWTLPVPDWQAPAVHPPAHRRSLVAVSGFVPPPSESFAAADEQPLFNPARTPIHGDGGSSLGGASGSLDDLTLVGVIGEGASRLAVIRTPARPLAVTVALGTDIDGWQVVRIDEDRIRVRGKGAEQELRLGTRPSPPATPQSQAAQ